MKVLFSSFAEPGHLYPLLPLAEAMRDAGHSVTFATGHEFTPALRSLGFQTVTAVGSITDALNRAVTGTQDAQSHAVQVQAAIWAAAGGAADMPGPEVIAEVAEVSGRFTANACRELLPVVDEVRPDLIVYEDVNIGAGLAGAARGVPSVSVSALLLGAPAFLHDAMAEPLAGVWTEISSEPFPDPQLRVDTRPLGFGDDLVDVVVPRTPMRPVPWGMPGSELPEWVTEPRDRPLVYVTMGSVPFAEHDRLRATIDGLAGLPVDVLVSVGDKNDPAEWTGLPESVRVTGFVRQDLVLPHVDVAVHHGGSGTTTGCLANGVPQLALPWMADQFPNALAIDIARVGLSLQYHEVTAPTVEHAVRELLDTKGYSARSQAFRETIEAMPSPSEVAAYLETLV
nr:glycosyltransferase [Kibdelosporangium sp. MJ126-NF4]CEL14465.1 Glycosyltransferase [Kibdelosporangium sp. MJ126-NF4]